MNIIPRITFALAIVAVVAVLLWLNSCQTASRRAVEASLNAEQGKAGRDSGNDAVGTVAAAGEREAGVAEMTRINEREIMNATGASDAVNPALRDAGIVSLCRRAAYKRDSRCLPHAPAR